MSFQMGEPSNHICWDEIFHFKIMNHFNLFNTFALVKTRVFLTHSRMLSIYDVLDQKWIKHFNLKTESTMLFRKIDENGNFCIGLIR